MAGTFQIGGLASGLDTGKIIDQLMSIERRPLTTMQKRQQALQDRKTALSDLTSKLSTLRLKAANLTISTNTQGRTATSSDTTVATATASSNAAIQTFDFTVTSMGTKTIRTSTSKIGSTLNTATVPMTSAGFSITPTSGTININGVDINVDVTTDSVATVLANINASAAGVTASYNAGTDEISIVSNTASTVSFGTPGSGGSNFLTAAKLDTSAVGTTRTSTSALGGTIASNSLSSANLATAPAASGTITINGTAIAWDNTQSLNTIIATINASGANVVASYDANTDKFSLQNKNTGATSISVSDTSGNLASVLGVSAAASETLGSNVSYQINGGTVQSSASAVITSAMSGVTLTALKAGTSTITIAQDVTGAVSAVKDFITAYNDALDLVRKDTAIDPATNTRSIFTGDSFIQGLESNLRAVAYTADNTLTGSYKTFTSIGVSTGAIGSAPNTTNDLVLDEAKLTAALTADPQAVTAFLTSTTGPVSTLSTYLFNATSFTGPLKAGQNSADDQIRSIGNQINDFQRRLELRQAALEKQFSDLEAQIAQLQGQSSQLASQLGSLGGSSK